MSRTKAVLIILALVFAALFGQPAEAQPKPSSEVLLPYFEVDLQSTGVTTLFAVGNAHKQAVEVQVTVYTNWGIPISTSKVTLAPNQIRSFDLRAWLTGDLPGRKLSKAEALNFKAQLMGQPAPKDKLYYSTVVAPNLAVGYVRMKVMGDPAPAALWGDYFLLNGSKTFGEGDTLVNIDQSVSCSPLCTRHALRYLTSGNFDGGTQLVVWSAVAGKPSKTPAGTAFVGADTLAYNDAGQAIGGKQLNLLPLQVVAVADLGLSQPNGWLDFQTGETPSVIAVHHSSKSKFGIALQSYCLPEIQVTVPGLRLKKLTNGEDANVAPGPAIPVGDPVLWEYIVENTGAVRISDIEVEDDRGVAVSCPKTALEPGESMTCTGHGTAEACQYENLGLVTGKTPNGQEVAHEDPSHYFGGQNAALDIEKLVNGENADNAPGIEVDPGSAVTWSYIVTNSGDVALNNIRVTDDDKTLTVTCPKGSLRPGESMTCTAQGKAINGVYKNIGTVSAGTSCGHLVSDSDPAYYTGAPDEGPAIDIEKHTNGEDADAAPGPRLLIGSPVVWEYIVTNLGDTTLSAVKVTDDQGVAVTCPKATLAVGESMTCTGRGTAREGQYKNIGSVTGTSPKGKTVRDQDPSHYFGGTDPDCPAIDIEKHTNGEDADIPTGPELLIGSPVLWEYFVTNTGNTQLSNVKVTDDQDVVVTCPKTTLAAGETMRCTGHGTARKGQYANIGTATGSSPKGKSVRDTDPSHYFGKDEPCDCPKIEIVKKTNGQHYDAAPGAHIPVGSPVTWTYEVKNTGKVVLSDIKVTDDRGVAVSCPKTTLQPGETMTCSGQGTAQACQYSNTGTATGKSPKGQQVSDSDKSYYYGDTHADIRIEKRTNGQHVPAAPGPQIPVGSPVTWTYIVTNTGDVKLKDVKVTDDRVANVSCPKTSLQPGESMTCTASGTAVEGQYKNIGTATGTADTTCGGTATDSDASYYHNQPLPPGIQIIKKTNGQHYDAAPGAHIPVGSPVTWTYEVKNIGQVVLSNIQVSDDRGVAVSCPKTTLQPGETMTCSGHGTAQACQYSNTGTATGKDPNGQPVSDSDVSFYYGETQPAIKIEKRTNGQHVPAAPGPELAVGSPVQWTYTVTNTGDVALKDVKVTDDRVANVSCPKTSLQPGESMTCSASGTAVQGQYKNVGTATGKADTSCGGTATDSDNSYYYGKPQQTGSQGCTPGYWKNHEDSWPATGYSTSQKVQSVFSQASGYPSLGNSTLHQALSFHGGSTIEGAAGNLLRAAVASLLDASHPGVDYPRIPASVISDVNAALATRNRDTILSLASALDRDNNLGCPLN